MKISGIYKITNKITNNCYIGSSKNIKKRWSNHKSSYTWKQHPSVRLYQAFQSYGLDNFEFEIIEETDNLREREQYFIDLLKPAYNMAYAKGADKERRNERQRKYNTLDNRKAYTKDYWQKRAKSDKYKNCKRDIYRNKFCFENEILTLGALIARFRKNGIVHPTTEAKKYLIGNN